MAGSGHSFWDLIEVLYEENQLTAGFNNKLVLVLNNTYNAELSLHQFVVFSDHEYNNLEISEHTSPIPTEDFSANETLIAKASENDIDFDIYDGPYSQNIEITPSAGINPSETKAPQSFKLVRARGAEDEETVMDITVVYKGSDETTATFYMSEIYELEEYISAFNRFILIIVF